MARAFVAIARTVTTTRNDVKSLDRFMSELISLALT